MRELPRFLSNSNNINRYIFLADIRAFCYLWTLRVSSANRPASGHPIFGFNGVLLSIRAVGARDIYWIVGFFEEICPINHGYKS
jgi:hypothetical protein